VVAARSASTADDVPGFSVTEYEPGAACSSLCENVSAASTGSEPIAPTVGRMGKSPSAAHPGPDRWVRLKPSIEESA
jgi:hypothetical protein